MNKPVRVFALGLVGAFSLALVLPNALLRDFSRNEESRLLVLMRSFDSGVPFVDQDNVLIAGFAPSTQSLFTYKEIVVERKIPFPVSFVKDSDLEQGSERVIQAGQEGKLRKTFLVKYYQGHEYQRVLLATQRLEPQSQIVAQGTKMVMKQVGIPAGPISYTQKLRVWATSYDGTCHGCRGRTATGTRVRKGVCAVDPRVIPLGTWFHVPGYGRCHAEDTGGNIKGKRVDLGFEDVAFSNWSAHYTDIFILGNK